MSAENETPPNRLEQLKQFTTIVADTSDLESIGEFKPQDATTNPSLVYAAAQQGKYRYLIEEVLAERKDSGLAGTKQIDDLADYLLVRFGCALLELLPGRVSTETDVRFSFDVQGAIEKARRVLVRARV